MSTTATAQEIERTVIESLKEFGVDQAELTPDASFEDLGVDSLDLAELAQVIEERYGIELKGSDVAEVRNVRDAVALITERA
ncbi:MAG TPA: acyl carrier protein [Solirubrobacteraceae bacterium]|nr:acyl carrier protein [Solirubrobacteraceae bacterium]